MGEGGREGKEVESVRPHLLWCTLTRGSIISPSDRYSVLPLPFFPEVREGRVGLSMVRYGGTSDPF